MSNCKAHETLKNQQTVGCPDCCEDVKVPTWDTVKVTCGHCAATFKVCDLFDHSALDCAGGWERARLESQRTIRAIMEASYSPIDFGTSTTWED